MNPTELDGKSISHVEVYADAITFEFADEATTAEVNVVDGALRLTVRRAPVAGSTTAGTSVYPGEGTRPKL